MIRPLVVEGQRHHSPSLTTTPVSLPVPRIITIVVIATQTTTIAIIAVATGLVATVLTTVKIKEKSDFCYSLGADTVVQYSVENFHDVLKSKNELQGVDLILDMIGGDYFEKNIDLLRHEGRLVHIAFLKGNSVKLDLSQLMMKRINLTGSTLRPRTVEFKSKVAGELRETVWPLLDRQKIRVYIDSVFPLEKFKDAHIRMESGNHLGKIILSLD